jgi:hypothetical protein
MESLSLPELGGYLGSLDLAMESLSLSELGEYPVSVDLPMESLPLSELGRYPASLDLPMESLSLSELCGYLGSLDLPMESLSLSELVLVIGLCGRCGGWSPRMPPQLGFPADVLPLDFLLLDDLLPRLPFGTSSCFPLPSSEDLLLSCGAALLVSCGAALLVSCGAALLVSCGAASRGVMFSSSGSSLKLNGRFAGSIFLKVMDILCIGVPMSQM